MIYKAIVRGYFPTFIVSDNMSYKANEITFRNNDGEIKAIIKLCKTSVIVLDGSGNIFQEFSFSPASIYRVNVTIYSANEADVFLNFILEFIKEYKPDHVGCRLKYKDNVINCSQYDNYEENERAALMALRQLDRVVNKVCEAGLKKLANINGLEVTRFKVDLPRNDLDEFDEGWWA